MEIDETRTFYLENYTDAYHMSFEKISGEQNYDIC